MADKTRVQADGRASPKKRPDGVSERPSGRASPGESGGGAYPNPHRGKKPKNSPGDFMGHGGQTEIAYHGAGQLGEDKVAPQEGARKAAAKEK